MSKMNEIKKDIFEIELMKPAVQFMLSLLNSQIYAAQIHYWDGWGNPNAKQTNLYKI